MRISTLLKISVSVTILMVCGLAVANWFVTAKLEEVSLLQKRAQAAAHDISKLLVLTHEYALYSEERAAQQWDAIQRNIIINLEAGADDTVPAPAEAFVEIKRLPDLFTQLMSATANKSDLQIRQRNLLLSQLQASSQVLADSVHHWGKTIDTHRQNTEHLLHVLTIVIPVLMFLILAFLTFLLNRRVLRPLSRLNQAVRAVAKGDLTVRSATVNDDELGELSRTFDAMAIDLVAEMKQEIIERKRAEEELTRVGKALKESEYFFKESQRSAHIGSYKADFTTGYWTSSEVMDSIFGIDAHFYRSIEGWLDIVHPDDRGMMAQYLREEVISKRKPFSKEYRIIRRNDGELRWVSGLGEAIFDNDGTVLALIGTIQDITERKRLEEERVALEQQLQQAQKLESLGVLAGGIAHDFNNLLAVIVGNCALAKLDPKKYELRITEIEKASERAAALCRQMLAYAGKTQFMRDQVDFALLVVETVNMLKSRLPHNAEIKLERLTDIPFIKGDASQLGQIVMNLIINASEAIGETQGEIRAALAKTVIEPDQQLKDHQGKPIQPGCYICLEVTDNGCGMSDETRQRIFEPFYTTKFTGRGLGMSAVLGTITSHGGALQLFSQLTQGTTFKVYLPVQTSESA